MKGKSLFHVAVYIPCFVFFFFRSLCRIAVMTSDGDLSVFDLKTGYASVTLQGKQNVNLAVVRTIYMFQAIS